MLIPYNEMERTLSMFDALRRRMDEVFGEPGGSGQVWLRREEPSWPRVNVDDAGGKLVVTAEVPGLSEKEIQVSLNQDVLTLSGERKLEPPKGYSVHRQERGSFRFSRSFTLPCKVNPEKCSATVHNGLLTLSLEKAAEAKPRQITVKAS